MKRTRLLVGLALAGWLSTTGFSAPPDLPDGTAKALATIGTLKAPAGLKIELFASEPKLASPVAIGLDERNRVFVAEEYRFNQGTEENRTRPFFLEEDLQVKTMDDRLAMIRKHAHRFEGGMDWFRKHSDQIRLLEDTNGDGKADKSTVFAAGFNDPLDGLGAGVMARDGEVWYTNIPNLWKLKDTNNDGIADTREVVATGFGTGFAFLGHDLHGLTWGPDGKLYFSLGDRGFHVTTREGKVLHGPRVGGVFRCNADGSELELVHRGLRNPQELAFDEHGNLFADDNNCDKGDHARLVYVVEGGETGWNMAYQTIQPPYMAGPWFAEQLWHLAHPGQAAYIVPPVGKLGAGPSGFVFNSGISLPDRYRNRFFMANYTGNGGIESFGVKPNGAGFEMVDAHDFLKPVMATDVDFGYDGKVYVSDFVNLLWNGGSAGGRIFTVSDPEKLKSPAVQQMKTLFAEGFDKQSNAQLAELLAHPDQRVRLRAQFTLVKRGSDSAAPLFAKTLSQSRDRLARLHAIWGLGQLGRISPNVARPVIATLADADAEVRAQSAKILGDVGLAEQSPQLIERLNDSAPRVRFFAAQSLGRLQAAAAIPALLELLRETGERDPYLRHAAVVALSRIGQLDELMKSAKHGSASIRMGIVLVLRRANDLRLTEFLSDSDQLVATEAARAVHDLELDAGLPALAATLPRVMAIPTPEAEPMIRRALHAHFRLGGRDNAQAVLAAVMQAGVPEVLRSEAVAMLREWSNPGPRDRVTGFWRPLPKRDSAIIREVVAAQTDALLTRTQGKLQIEAIDLLTALNLPVDEAKFASWSVDNQRDASLRQAAMRLLAVRKSAKLAESLQANLLATQPEVRATARTLLSSQDPAKGLPLLQAVLDDPKASLIEQQAALAQLPELKLPAAATLLDRWAERLRSGSVPTALQLDVLDALKTAASPSRDAIRTKFEGALAGKPFGKFAVSLQGGDPERGRELFIGHAAAQCIRCHMIHKQGGNAGPDLTEVVKRNPMNAREHLLESMLNPGAKIAEGYGTVTVTLDDERIITGTIVSETPQTLTLKNALGETVPIAKDRIELRSTPLSPMPAMDRTLTPREARDLVEYLMSVK
ncbi:PVC-type heme-binding CxxCH protein [Tuwongella immobilis]|uniref:Cytochrome c domain-containing protein n=1 Tax=Tuwongella immobilis TaxID=692036 RepID=A0A6C2YSZ7_9BACT|nr:PVC-type heme-binding CxxCH protein [Tuwongella immobilis]VIP04514.1 heme-binding protein : Membrane-bound dehydrogenase domain protein OS=Pirellula staleyi (strain ATCC 27377 / DSM 6068 / ICPB 4128) GN=Psta_0686 PE=4 SV=1: GSDH: HEAT_2: Cytochrom_C [Tuwongella immobilis]VTS06390.1 heme-binding protein : Membrane-bound dehydrogenase domain protein OS=Pirellula staleyi (strain ATCC 27377 / DSM 6068 / ICPB 4128) GN=Psta_0686 PE=4 SV=1: GSDH: HEAT_2: Cytochrom_C [Tuwongella immobilis]